MNSYTVPDIETARLRLKAVGLGGWEVEHLGARIGEHSGQPLVEEGLMPFIALAVHDILQVLSPSTRVIVYRNLDIPKIVGAIFP